MSDAAVPYVSVAFTNRNDNYGGDLEARILKFIDYYAAAAAGWPGLFEFVICDWNPPEGRPKLADAFPWDRLGNVLHVEVPPAIHARIAGAKGRKMLDYIGRNVAIRRGRGTWSLVLNQDIFLCREILATIAERSLDTGYFYRADRCDFDFEATRSVEGFAIADAARGSAFQIHRRHQARDTPITVPVTPDTIAASGSNREAGDVFDNRLNIAYGLGAHQMRAVDRINALIWDTQGERRASLARWREMYLDPTYFNRFLLHTNASGDFILAPRAAFDKIHGMFETVDFYIHLDGYAIAQLFAAGYGQALFCAPFCAFHADHDRSGRADFKEEIGWPEHLARLSEMLRGDNAFRLNGADWGLHKEYLPIRRIPETAPGVP